MAFSCRVSHATALFVKIEVIRQIRLGSGDGRALTGHFGSVRLRPAGDNEVCLPRKKVYRNEEEIWFRSR
jgi:hypothetical protein